MLLFVLGQNEEKYFLKFFLNKTFVNQCAVYGFVILILIMMK